MSEVGMLSIQNQKKQGFRSLAEQQDVEFDVESDHMGREKAINVTAPGGGDPRPYARDNY